MAYTNSPLVSYTKLSPNHSGQRTHSIDRITPHCVVGQCSVETLATSFCRPRGRQAATTASVSTGGSGMYVEEKKPLLVFFFRSQRPESHHHRVCQRQHRALTLLRMWCTKRLIELAPTSASATERRSCSARR